MLSENKNSRMESSKESDIGFRKDIENVVRSVIKVRNILSNNKKYSKLNNTLGLVLYLICKRDNLDLGEAEIVNATGMREETMYAIKETMGGFWEKFCNKDFADNNLIV